MRGLRRKLQLYFILKEDKEFKVKKDKQLMREWGTLYTAVFEAEEGEKIGTYLINLPNIEKDLGEEYICKGKELPLEDLKEKTLEQLTKQNVSKLEKQVKQKAKKRIFPWNRTKQRQAGGLESLEEVVRTNLKHFLWHYKENSKKKTKTSNYF